MGWLWASSKESSASTTPPQESNPPDTFDPPPPTDPDCPSTPTTTDTFAIPQDSAAPLSREQAANAELRTFLQSLQQGYATSRTKAATETSQSPSRTPATPLHNPSIPKDVDLITATNVHPTALSCRTAFDTAFYCASLGGQFTSLYRYGQLRRCSQEWGDFWFCMRTNRGFMSEEEREDRIVEWGIKREKAKYYAGAKVSSEDVWEARKIMVPRSAMQGDLEAVMEEQKREAERRGEGNGWRAF